MDDPSYYCWFLPLIVIFMFLFSDFSSLVWNIRGCMNSRSKRHLKDVLRITSSIICVIMEPQGPFGRISNFFYKNNYEAVHVIECVGRSGGIWILKRIGSFFDFEVSHITPRSITLKVKRGGLGWYFTAIYANPYYPARTVDWQHIRDIAPSISGPWLAIGDWNEILEPSEVVGGDFNATRALAFRDFLMECGL